MSESQTLGRSHTARKRGQPATATPAAESENTETAPSLSPGRLVEDPALLPWPAKADVPPRARSLDVVKSAISSSEARMRLLTLLAITLVALNGGIIHLALNPPESPYRVSAPAKINEDGSISHAVGGVRVMDQQLLTGTQAEDFAVRAITRALNFNFGNYLEVQNSMRPFFTAAAWDVYRENLREGFLDTVVFNKQILTTMINEPPVIISEGDFDGRYTWNIETIIMINVRTGPDSETQCYIAQAGVVELPLGIHDRPMAIDRLVFRKTGSCRR